MGIFDTTQKNLTQYTFSFFGVSSDVSSEFMILFMILFAASVIASCIYEVFLAQNILRPQKATLAMLYVPIFTISAIYFIHHATGWPNIHKSMLLFNLTIDTLLFKWVFVTWTISISIVVLRHLNYKSYRKELKRSLIGALSPLALNLILFVSHYLIKFPAAIY